MTLRTVRVAPERLAEAVALATQTTQLINERHGAQLTVSTQVGGDPGRIVASSRWESLGDYQSSREAYMADPDIAELVAQGAPLWLEATDQILRLLAAPGERQSFAAVNRAQIKIDRIAEAIPLALEISEFIEAKTAMKIGFASAVTGLRSQVAWIGFYPSLDSIVAVADELEADPDYLEFFKRSGDLFVESSLEQEVWQRVE